MCPSLPVIAIERLLDKVIVIPFADLLMVSKIIGRLLPAGHTTFRHRHENNVQMNELRFNLIEWLHLQAWSTS